MRFFNDFTREIIGTGVLLIIILVLRIVTTKLVRRYAKLSQTIERRTNLVIKYIHLFINILAIVGLIIIWGVQTKDIFIAISSIATIVGVAMIAQWSVLSNITSGIILFFYFPFKIGDTIRIHDKDFPIEGEIEDIGAFLVYLNTKDGEKIIYPNNLLLQKGISILGNEYENKEFTD
ncbi:mechanosensitive ion channel domain-containing protein [Flavobacterium sp. 123]|uniref:mechanosensitive ion channel domain-containing protein n=1 Tax=Flavobacterium sp. 123 TaxID=2135627 RepID=UPI000EB589CA|nr:mechanosensitive ion channel domain-containing protein [Flavobacterium sp. 123]RKT00617.1 mechanosensitive ion channel-like protein [Flavobacterium sp. 123]